MTRVRVQQLPEGRLPTVTVVIPTYNYAQYLAGAVESAANQEGVEVEIIIVDDASTDDSVNLAQSLAAADARITVVAHEINAGHIATYNDGLARAAGDYVVLLSADDLLPEGCLGRAARLMENHPNVGLVYGFALTFTGMPPVNESIAAGSRVESWSVWSGSDWITRMCERGSNTIINPEAIMRRSVLHQTGFYDAELPQSADMMLWMRAAAAGDIGRVNGRVQGYYRVHGENMHLTTLGGGLRELNSRTDTFTRFFGASGSADDARLGIAKRALAREGLRRAIALLSAPADREPGSVDGTSMTDRISAAEYAQFAKATDPGIVDSRSWKTYLSRRRSHVHPLVGYAELRTERVRSIVRWRRWRRYGT
ncbi:MAG: glycosyl transferase family 2 [Subtercola sp.]|nr:glycosyl transferase family 2 [Subtercola sp.]